MFDAYLVSDDRDKNRRTLLEVLPHYVSKDDNWVTVLANVSALINVFFDTINWVGFYIKEGDTLYLGPFQGNPACTKIALGRGVCGLSALNKHALIVDDVSLVNDHIVCDQASQSELVVPIIKDGEVLAVIDVDSPVKNRFNEADKEALEVISRVLVDIAW